MVSKKRNLTDQVIIPFRQKWFLSCKLWSRYRSQRSSAICVWQGKSRRIAIEYYVSSYFTERCEETLDFERRDRGSEVWCVNAWRAAETLQVTYKFTTSTELKVLAGKPRSSCQFFDLLTKHANNKILYISNTSFSSCNPRPTWNEGS